MREPCRNEVLPLERLPIGSTRWPSTIGLSLRV
jgi:hypothetical protein